jgi:glucokinase
MKNLITPAYLHPVDPAQMRQVNRSIILEIVRQNSPIARSEISRALGLSMPTIVRIMDDLVGEGLVRYTGETAGSAGRPRELLEYNKDGFAVIGIDLGGTKLYGALADIGGEILGEARRDQHHTSGEDSFDMVADLIQSLLDLPRPDGQKLLGIAVGAPGVTHSLTGVVEWAPSLNWRNFPLKSRLEAQFGLPAMIENDVNLAALGEQWFGAGKGVNNLALIALGTGVGAGLIIDGAIYRGHHEAAGEVGYLLPSIDALGRRYDGFGAMESIISGVGIAERARQTAAAQLSAAQLTSLSAGDVFQCARQGQAWAVKIVDETVDYLTMLIANVATLIDPELIVLGGGVANSSDLLIPPIQRRLDGLIQHIPRLEVSTLGAQATVMGAIALTLHTTREYYFVRRLF